GDRPRCGCLCARMEPAAADRGGGLLDRRLRRLRAVLRADAGYAASFRIARGYRGRPTTSLRFSAPRIARIGSAIGPLLAARATRDRARSLEQAGELSSTPVCHWTVPFTVTDHELPWGERSDFPVA